MDWKTMLVMTTVTSVWLSVLGCHVSSYRCVPFVQITGYGKVS